MEPRGRAVPGGTATSPESAMASELFDQFVSAGTFKSVLFTYRQICDVLRLKPTNMTNFYPRLKAKLHSWRAASLWAKLDKRASHKCYNRGKACPNTRVLIIGAGPCGLRAAIEAQLLGSKVVVVEKRDRFSRNNVLHLWPFVIHDLRNLGAKKFFGKFCAGSIDHISIRQLQLILLKVALLLGVEVHENVGFESLVEPPEDQTQERIGWHARVSPTDHPVSQYEFDVLIGADGKRNTLLGFNRKEFRGKLAIAVTANFINRHTIEEARVPEISGVAFIFNQKFFQDMRDQTAIDLENIVYYKDDTHYFVMTAKKQSLLERRVIIRDYNDTARLLAPENVDREALMEYARDAADFATSYQLPSLDFAVNHYGQADVAMFDFTSMYAAENACRVLEKRSHKLLQGLVGDSLLEPFWPTGSGCARGFLSSFDAAWMIRSWASGKLSTLQVLAEREAIYRLLAQTTPENLSKDLNQYTLNPCSRYPNLNLQVVLPSQVRSLYDTDGKIEESILDIAVEIPKKKKRRESMIHPDTLLNWCQKQVALSDKIKIQDFTSSWKNGLALCTILHRYRPDLIDITALDPENIAKNNQLAFDICERELGIPPIMTGQEMSECAVPDKLSMVSYISQVYESFRGEIPVVSYSKSNSGEERNVSPNRHHGTPLSVLNRLSNRLINKRKYSIEKEAKDRERGENVKKRSSLLTHKRRSKERGGIAMDLTKQDVILTDYQSIPSGKPRESINTRVKNLEEKLKRDAGLRCHIEDIESCKTTRLRSDQTELNIKLLQEQLQKNGSENVKKARTPKVGKLRKDEWNAKIFEEKSRQQSALSKSSNVEKPKVIKEIFVSKVNEMDEKLKSGGLTASEEARFKKFDDRLHKLKTRLSKGNLDAGEKGHNQTAAMTEHMTTIWDRKSAGKKDPLPPAPVYKAHTETDSSTSTAGSEICYFCKKHVYLMERLSAEGLFFHRSCFQCEYCSASLRLGNYSFDRDAFCGGKFYCTDHFRKQKPDHRTQEIMKRKEAFLSCALEEQQKEKLYKTLLDNTEKALSPNKPAQTAASSTPKDTPKTPEEQKSGKLSTPSNLLAEPSSPYGRDQTPERVEYENSIMEMSEEELLTSELEEEELTQKNLGPSQDLATSDDDYSDLSTDTESDEEAFAEELERSLTADETRKLAETWNKKYSAGHSLIESDSTSSSSSSSSSADDEGSETEIGTDTSDDIDSDAEYSVENSEGSDKQKKDVEVTDVLKSEIKDEFTVEVPIIDLKSMNRVTDDESNSDSEISEEISDSEENSEGGESGTEVDSESEPKAPIPPPQIPTIVIFESPPQDVDLDQKWDCQDPSTKSTEAFDNLSNEENIVHADESVKDVELPVEETHFDETPAISTKDDLVSKNAADGKLSDTDKNFDFSCFRTDKEFSKTEALEIKMPIIAPLATEESSSDNSLSSGVNYPINDIVHLTEDVTKAMPDYQSSCVKKNDDEDSSISEKSSSSEKLKKYSMLDSASSSSSSSRNIDVIDLCSPEQLKLENIPIVDLCSPLSPEIEHRREPIKENGKVEIVPLYKPDILSNVPLFNLNTSDLENDSPVTDLTINNMLKESESVKKADETIMLDDSVENILETSMSDQIVVDNKKSLFDESFVTVRNKRKRSVDDVFDWDNENEVSLPLCYSAIHLDEETDLSKDGIYHADVVQAVDTELVDQFSEELIEDENAKAVEDQTEVFEAVDKKLVENVNTELVEKAGTEIIEEKDENFVSEVATQLVEERNSKLIKQGASELKKDSTTNINCSLASKASDMKAKAIKDILPIASIDSTSSNSHENLCYTSALFASPRLEDAKLSVSVPKSAVFPASVIKSLSGKKEDLELNLSNQKSPLIYTSDKICDKVTEENTSKTHFILSDEKPKDSKGISPKEESKYKGYSGSFAEKVRPKSLFCDTLYLRSLDIKLKQPFSDLTKSNDKLDDYSKPMYDEEDDDDDIKKKLFCDSNDSLDIDEKDSDVFLDDKKPNADESSALLEKVSPSCLKDETNEQTNKPKNSAHKHPSVSFYPVEPYSDLVSPYTSAQITSSDNNFPTKMRPKCDIDINKLRQKREKRKSVHEDIQGLPFADEEKIVSPVDPLGNSDVFMTPKAILDADSKNNLKSSESDVFATPAWKGPDLVDEERYLRLQSTVEQEKARQEARARARLKSDEELGLSPNNYRKKYKRQLSLNSINYDELCSDEFYDQDDEIEDDIINNFCQSRNSGIEETFSMFKNSDFYLKGKNSETPSTSSQHSLLKTVKCSLKDDLSLLSSNMSPPGKAMSASTGTLKFNDSHTQNDLSKSASVLPTSKHSSKTNSPETSPDVICADISPFDSKFNSKGKSKNSRVEYPGDDDKSKSNGKKSIFSILNFGKGNVSKEKPKQKQKEPEKELSSSLPNDFGARSVSKSKPFSHLKLSKSKEKTTKLPKAKPVPLENIPNSPLENTPAHEDPLTLSLNTQQAKIIPKYAVYRNPETMISTFPVHLPVPKLENGLAPKASEDSFSDEDDTKGSKVGYIPSVEKNDKSSNEKEKKAQRIVQKVKRQQVLKRLRNAQEIQRRLEELEVEQRDLECHGVELEKMFRGERHEGNDKKGEADLMQEWYSLLHTKNKLMREEQELLIRLKDLELEDRQSKLQQDMRERMAQTDLKDAAQIKQEREILTEMLEIVEKRNELVAMLDQLRLREMEEEKNIHSEVFTKGMKSPLSPVGKS